MVKFVKYLLIEYKVATAFKNQPKIDNHAC